MKLSERCETEEASDKLDAALAEALGWRQYRILGRSRWMSPQGFPASVAPSFTHNLQHAFDAIPPGWVLLSLSEMWGDGQRFARIATVDGVAEGLAGRSLPLTLMSAVMRAVGQ